MATFQKDGLWVQGGLGALASVNEETPFVAGQLGRVMSIRSTDGKVPRFYQYVKRYATETAALAAGTPAYWQDLDDFVITADSASAIGSTTNALVAGAALGAYPAAGKYGFIEVAGIASVAVTGTAGAGDLLVPAGSQFTAVLTVTQTQAFAANVPAVAIALSAVETSTDSSIDALLRPARNGW